MPANWNATSRNFQLPVIMTSVLSIMVMLMHLKIQNCIIYLRPDHTLMRRSCYSCLPWGFRTCAMWCYVAGIQFPAVSKELLFTLVSTYVFLSWINLYLHIKQFRSARSAQSDNVVRSGSDIFRRTSEAMYVLCNIEQRSRNHCCFGKAITIRYSKCVPAALTQHVKRMHLIILSSAAYPSVLYFSTLSHKRHDFRKRNYIP